MIPIHLFFLLFIFFLSNAGPGCIYATELNSREAKTSTTSSDLPRILLIGGFPFNDLAKDSMEYYDPWGSSNASLEELRLLEPRHRHVSGQLGDGIVLITGGYRFSDTHKSSQIYDPIRKTMEWGPSMSVERAGPGAAVLNGSMYVCGGFKGPSLKSCERYSPKSEKWEPIPPMQHDRSGLAMAAVGHYIYAFGGTNATSNNGKWVEQFDTQTGQWEQVGDMPVARWGSAAVAIKSSIYLCGGQDSNSKSLKSCQALDIPEMKWRDIASMNEDRILFGLLAVNDGLIALGGFYSSAARQTAEFYDMEKNEWRLLPKTFIQPRGASAFALVH